MDPKQQHSPNATVHGSKPHISTLSLAQVAYLNNFSVISYNSENVRDRIGKDDGGSH